MNSALRHLLPSMLGCCLLLPLAAQAQWQWIDNTGKKVFSDTAPPPDVPEKNILRKGNLPPPRPAPGVVALDQGGTAAPPGASPVAGTPAPAPKSGVDKELQEKAKKAEDEEKAKKEAEEKKLAQAKAENCSRARQAKATYDSGIRVARVNAQGEREIVDDAARAQETRRLQQVIDSDCK